MFTDLFGLNGFDQSTLLKFTLTVRKNYRRVPYHNWTHGFSVANSMYCIIKHSKGVFRQIEILSPSVNPATPRERRVQAHLELAELVEILARLLVMRKSDTQLAFCCSGNRD
ncbi:hypothetical protein NQ317_015239 [Molorchus minor]|uniref:PDEase domain-containing protein n=1 Tax=Molorchus minor TaxID=1323400 RepID=A0ABQ9JQX1_9CUCU|nr:hypothetical protein NQ317_015239 [Molorchus minor]